MAVRIGYSSTTNKKSIPGRTSDLSARLISKGGWGYNRRASTTINLMNIPDDHQHQLPAYQPGNAEDSHPVNSYLNKLVVVNILTIASKYELWKAGAMTACFINIKERQGIEINDLKVLQTHEFSQNAEYLGRTFRYWKFDCLRFFVSSNGKTLQVYMLCNFSERQEEYDLEVKMREKMSHHKERRRPRRTLDEVVKRNLMVQTSYGKRSTEDYFT
ncbi:hypothetical protein CR513_49116, partial [Mucuna pruriens]